METHNTKYLTIAVALILVIGIGGISYNLGKKAGAKNMHQEMAPVNHSEMSMDQMLGSLEDLQGDAFDKAFIEMMIVHHQGAVDMAKHIPAQAKHEELKKLGADIIAAQTKEIEMMQGWLTSWGYNKNNQTMEHSMMGH